MNINTKKGPIFDPGVCRCCGEVKKCRLLNIEYEWRGQKEIYSDMFVDCFGLLLSHLDGEYLERLICATCVSRLREASSFREQVLQCEEKLLTTKICEEDSPNTNVKEESKVKEELDTVQNDCHDDVTLEYHDNDIDYVKVEAVVKRKSLRQKLKAAKTVKKDDVLTKEMLHDTQRLKKKLKAMQDIDNPNTKAKEESKVKEELDTIQNDYHDDVTLEYHDNDTDYVKDEALVKPKRKSLRQKLKAAKKVKTVKKDDVLTKQMSYDAQRLKKELKDEVQDIELPEQSTQQLKQNGYKTNENIKSYQNFVTIVENSYACPFDTSFSDFFCVYCRQVFTDPNKLREHSMTHDPSTLKNVLLNTTSYKKLQIDIYRIDCRLCSENIDDLRKFTDHIKSIHQKTYHHNSENFLKYRLTSASPSCTECGATFSFFHALKKHMAEHFGTCICDMCGAHYFEERMLILHQKTHQKVEESFACKECGKTFKSKYTRYIHIARTHKKEAAYQCNTCDELFFSYTLRYRHMIKVHGEERTFKCEKCDRVYDSRKSLREHNRRFHLKILKHHCDLCDKRFYLPSRLKEHMASHTGERNFRCEYCGKSYPRLRGLKVHMQSHSSEKKYKCDLCNASFVQNINLKNHVKRQHQSVEMEENYIV